MMFFNVKYQKPKRFLVVSKDKKYVMIKLVSGFGTREYKVQCDKDDKFEWHIGLGLAISRFIEAEKYKQNKMYKMVRDFYRKRGQLDYKKYANWCIIQFFQNNVFEIADIDRKVKAIKENGCIEF